jgi:L-lactate dehydrogenase (cytochrome)
MLSALFGRATIHSCADARRLAQYRLPWMVFDYIDGAAGEGYGEVRMFPECSLNDP